MTGFGEGGKNGCARKIEVLQDTLVGVVELVRNLVAHGDARGGSEGETGEWSG